MAFVHIKKPNDGLGETRSQQAENLRRVYGVSGGLSDEDLDKAKWLEKKAREQFGVPPPWVDGEEISQVK